MIEITQTVLGIQPGMRTAIVAPLYHSAPASYGMQSLLNGELVVIHERFDAERLLADIETHKLDRLYLVPTHMVRLLRLPDEVKRKYDLSSVQFVASTGSPCPPEVKKQMIDWWGPVINESYASSEAGFITLLSSEESRTHPGSAGPAGRGRRGAHHGRCRQAAAAVRAGADLLPPGRLSGLHLHQPAG